MSQRNKFPSLDAALKTQEVILETYVVLCTVMAFIYITVVLEPEVGKNPLPWETGPV